MDHLTWPKYNLSTYLILLFTLVGVKGFNLRFLFQREYEPAENMKPKEGQEMSKSAAKNKKKREAKARAKQEQETSEEVKRFTFYVQLSGNI